MKIQQSISRATLRVLENVRRVENMLEEDRDFFSKLREEVGTNERYVDAIWNLRYPRAFPKASSAWPYRSAENRVEIPNKVRALRP